MNSVSESLYFSVPLIMLPQTAEQKGVSQRVSDMGAGIKLDKIDAKSLLRAVNTILNETSYKENAEKIAEGFKNASGVKGAADKIIKVCSEVG